MLQRRSFNSSSVWGMTKKTAKKIYVHNVHHIEVMNEQIANKIVETVRIGGSR
jgi:hypothetical protein